MARGRLCVEAIFDLTDDGALVLESEAAVPSGKVTATLSHAGAVPGFKASLSGQPKDTSTAKLALQWMKGGAGVKCDLTELVSGDAFKCPKAEVSACYSAAAGDSVGW